MRRFVVGVTGSSAPHLGYRLLLALQQIDGIETHLVISRGARLSIPSELDVDVSDFEALADVVYDIENLGASISSGSFRTLGMAVVPCSMRTLGAIASGSGGDLIARAADVSLKERRPLVLVTRRPRST